MIGERQNHGNLDGNIQYTKHYEGRKHKTNLARGFEII